MRKMPFQYISFQRLPPQAVSPGQVIQIAPLIANDLREEVYSPTDEEGAPSSVDLKLAWVVERTQQGRRGFALVKEEKSIEWTGPETSYKKVDITCPTVQELRKSQHDASSQLRLAIWADKSTAAPRSNKKVKTSHNHDVSSHLIVGPADVVRRSQAGEDVLLPVLTPPIDIVSGASSSKPPSKLSHIARMWAYDREGGQGAAIEVLEEIGFELDKHVWDASIPLLSLLAGSTSTGSDGAYSTLLENAVILELGAGTGMLSIALARLLPQTSSRLFASDLAPALELIKRNKALNGLDATSAPQAIELDWFAEELPSPLAKALASSDDDPKSQRALLVLASDCSYNPDSYAPFTSLLARLLRSAPKKSMALVSKKHRHADEVKLWSHLRDAGLRRELVEGADLIGQEGGAEETSEEDASIGRHGIYAITTQQH